MIGFLAVVIVEAISHDTFLHISHDTFLHWAGLVP